MTSRIHLAATLLLAVSMSGAGCTTNGHPVAPDGTVNGVRDLAAETAFCVAELNRLRATVGDPPLARSDTIDAFSAEAARVDAQARQPHTHFRQTNGGQGTATAENEIPWWTLSKHGSVQGVIRDGLAMMWAEGPGGDHFDHMRGRFSKVGCGVYIANGEVTVAQDFY